MGSIEKARAIHVDYDVIIVGAGISGVNSAYRIQTEIPDASYTVLEARGAIGGTWDLFRYPGIRSDSDLHTFGFPWRPWNEKKSIADGESIRKYVRESAEQYGLDRKIQFHHKVTNADWSSEDQYWTFTIEANGRTKVLTSKWVIWSTGYYDYNKPLETHIPGLENFKGRIIHPQFWPEDFDETGKKIVVIGSGATAITLIPNLAEKAEKVTMLQRSPSYIMSLPAVDPTGNFLRKILPTWLSSRLTRWKFLILPYLFFSFCRSFPNAARNIIKKRNAKNIPKNIPQDPHFKPRYNPWEQRLCICPDGDFFKSLQSGKGDIVTGNITTVTETGIEVDTGKTVDADVIVTATGLKVIIAGGTKMTIDDVPLDPSQKFMWKGVMLQDVPNAAIVVGYTNASWTLGADCTAQQVCRLIKRMNAHNQASATPRLTMEKQGMKVGPFLNLNSTYIEKAKGELPKAGDTYPWLPRSNYFVDVWRAQYGDLTADLQFVQASWRGFEC